MIFQKALELVAVILGGLASLLPTWDPVDLSDFFEVFSCDQFECIEVGGTEFGGPVFRLFGWANHYVPLTELSAVIGLTLTLWFAVKAWKLIVWIAGWVRGGGSEASPV